MFSTKTVRWLLSMLAVTVLLSALVACGPAAETEEPEETAPVPTEETEETEPEGTEPTEEEKTSITILIPSDPPGFNYVVAWTGYENVIANLALLGMADVDPWGEIYPVIAEELPTVENGGVVVDEESGTMDVTWKMREDVTWADGEPLTADDVLFTWEAIVDPETGGWVPGVDYTDSIEKIDDYTFVVHYNGIFPNYLLHLGGEEVVIWPEHFCDPEQGFIFWDCNRQPLSSGPYVLEEWKANDHLTFTRNPYYFEEGKPYIDEVVVQVVPDESVRKTMMMEGDGDVDFWVADTIAEELEESPNVELSLSPINRWIYRLWPNLAARGSVDPVADPHPILSDVQVRHAIRMAVDVDTIMQEILLGNGEPVWTEFNREPYVCDIPRPEYNPEGAKALLDEAGWTDEDGDGIRECHGCTTGAPEGYMMSMELATYSDLGELGSLMQQVIAENLLEIGIELQLSQLDMGVMFSDSASGGTEQLGQFDLDLWDISYVGPDPTDHMWNYYYSTAAQQDYGWNVERWMNEEFDALLDQAYTLDEDRREELFCEMAELLDEELPCIIMYASTDITAHSSRLQNLQGTTQDMVTWNAAEWKVAEE